MKTHFWSHLLFVLFMPILACAQLPAVDDGEICGTVNFRRSEVGIPNVTVQLSGTGQQTLTDKNGQFRFDKLRPGIYTLTVTVRGYRQVNEVVPVKSGQTTEVQIKIEGDVFTLEEIETQGKVRE